MDRLTEKQIAEFMARIQTKTDTQDGTTSALVRIETELDRARREEIQQKDRIHALEVQQADLIRQVKKKDTQIKALADALEQFDEGGNAVGCECCTVPDARKKAMADRDAALRRAGRAP